ncbi:hypothetical protein F5Y14DRAFT_451416 [Nemania sp. NC0429]|nr:hypothetical protein F5Y14DRAFT_451416 [Nemania sp. NC0429]
MPGVFAEDPLAGLIQWLPRKGEFRETNSTIEDGSFDHPVVILSSKARNGMVEILILTSLKGVDFETKFPYPKAPARRHHLPIAPLPAHPDNRILLVLKDPTRELRKKSYVKTGTTHSVRLASLKPYSNTDPKIYLSEHSYRTLVDYIHYSEPEDEGVLKELWAIGEKAKSLWSSFLRAVGL